MLIKIHIAVFSNPEFLASIRRVVEFGTGLHVQFASGNADAFLAHVTQSAKSLHVAIIDNRSGQVNADFMGQIKIPVLVIASDVVLGFEMLKQGADMMLTEDAVLKEPSPFTCQMLYSRIKEMLKEYNAVKTRAAKRAGMPLSGKIIAIGASTGGTESIIEVLKKLPADCPPVLIVQHMPPVFTRLYAERVDKLCAIEVWEAQDGDRLANGLALVAPGDFHMVLAKKNNEYIVHLHKGEPVQSQRPAADILFESVAKTAGANAVGVILTGMGEDGARGLHAMRQKGAYTIGQDEATSMVYGMPRAAHERGAVLIQLPLSDIAQEIMKQI